MKHTVCKCAALALTISLVGCSSSQSSNTGGKAQAPGGSQRNDQVAKAPSDRTSKTVTPTTPPPTPPPSPSPAPPPPAPEPKKDEGALPTLETQVVEALSAARTKEGFAALRTSVALATAARAHATALAETKKLDANLDLKTLQDRLKTAGYVAQNLAQIAGAGSQPDAKMVVDSWLKNPMIRAQIMNSALEEAGVGVQRDATGTRYYYTLVLATEKK